MEFSAKSAKQIFEVFSVYIVSFRFISLQALSTDPERGMRVEELERLLAVETGGEELGAHTFLVSTKESFQQVARKFCACTKKIFRAKPLWKRPMYS